MNIASKFGLYNYGTYYEKKTDTQGERLRFEILQSKSRAYSQIVNNLIATQGTITIRTNDNLEYKINGFITFRGTKYIISQVVEMEEEINPQILIWKKKNPNTDFIISLIEVENIYDK